MNIFFNNYKKGKKKKIQPARQTERKEGKISQTMYMKEKKSCTNIILNEYRNAGADTHRQAQKKRHKQEN